MKQEATEVPHARHGLNPRPSGRGARQALQDKVWVHGPGAEPWEVYVVKADADTLGKSDVAVAAGSDCCGAEADRADENKAEAEQLVEAKAGAGCC